MSKLIFACVMLSSASLLDPAQVVNFFGPSAHTIGSKLRNALDFDTLMPGLKRRDHR